MSVIPSSFEIKESTNWGKFITAKRNYVIGDVILDEAPFIISPLKFKPTSDKTKGKRCLGCSKQITKFRVACLQCRWPMCSLDCTEEPFHKRYECVVFKNNNIKPNNRFAIEWMHIIRVCMMYKDKENPKNWQDFTSLSSKLERQTNKSKASLKQRIRSATKWINHICNLKVGSKTVGIIIRTFMANGFTLDGDDENGTSYEAQLLYKTGCLFAHSCSPNTEWVVLPTNQNGIERWHLRIYAMRNIYCEESITIPYRQDFLTTDTATRKLILETSMYFECKCERCLDPSEFNLYTSALKCGCGNTTLLPDNLNDEHSSWTCRICGDCKDSLEMNDYIEEYEDSLRSLIEYQNTIEFESCLEMLLNSRSERHLTENHRVITRTMYYWLRSQNFKDLLEHTMESEHKFIKILQRAAKCLKMFRMFNTLQSILYMELIFAYAIASFYFKTGTFCSIEYDKYSPKERKQIVSAVYAHLKIAVQIMEWDPYNMLDSPVRDRVLKLFTFWESEWESLKGIDTEAADHIMSVNRFQEYRLMHVFDQVKIHLGKLWMWSLGWAYTYSKTWSNDSESQSPSIGQSVVENSSNDSELIVSKPDVSLLSQYDFYFTN